MTRNLLYYIYPISGGMLNLNLNRLSKYFNIFNGRRIFYVATDGGSLSVEDLRKLLKFHGIEDYELKEVCNDPQMGEAAYFLHMFDEVLSSSSNDITFFAHAKGVSPDVYARRKTGIQQISIWIDWLYRLNLQDVSAIERVMSEHPCAGTFKYNEHKETLETDWYYAGTFFWFRHDKMFAEGWRTSTGSRNAAEEYLGNRFKFGEVYCWDNLTDLGWMYDREFYDQIEPIENNFDPGMISLVLSVRNGRSIYSWIGHPFKEIIVCANRTKELEKEFPSIKWVTGEKNRDLAVRISKGRYILFVGLDMKLNNWEATECMTMKKGRFLQGPELTPSYSTCLVSREDYSEGQVEDFYERLEKSGVRRFYYLDDFVVQA